MPFRDPVDLFTRGYGLFALRLAYPSFHPRLPFARNNLYDRRRQQTKSGTNERATALTADGQLMGAAAALNEGAAQVAKIQASYARFRELNATFNTIIAN